MSPSSKDGSSFADTPDIGFVCCIESGWLESQTTLLVESLRRFGGRFANAPMVAVTPRSGPPLSRATRTMLDRHQVEYVRVAGHARYSWFNYLNKPLAVLEAQKRLATSTVAFLDSDLLITGEPQDLELKPGEDFCATPIDIKEMGTAGPGDPFEKLWEESCRCAGLDIGSLPWVETAESGERIRLYFNSGVFCYRRELDFATQYLKLCLDQLDARIVTAATGFGLGFKEQASVGLAVIKLGARWRPLSYSCNYPLGSSALHQYRPERLRSARIVHYHDAVWAPHWVGFLQCLREEHPQVAQWLADRGPMRNTSPILWRLLAKPLGLHRRRSAERYKAAGNFC